MLRLARGEPGRLAPSLFSLALGLASNGQEELELWGQLVLGVQAVGEVNAANTAVRVDLHSKIISYDFPVR